MEKYRPSSHIDSDKIFDAIFQTLSLGHSSSVGVSNPVATGPQVPVSISSDLSSIDSIRILKTNYV